MLQEIKTIPWSRDEKHRLNTTITAQSAVQ